jgi:hypothetical protein
MPDSTVGSKIHKPLDIHRSLSAKVAFDRKFCDDISEFRDLRITQILDLERRIHLGYLTSEAGATASNTEDMRQRDSHLLISGDVDTCYTSHMYFLNPVAAYDVDRSKSLEPHAYGGRSCSFGKSFLLML